jgi:GNAT superfamily N-acetyltransferase
MPDSEDARHIESNLWAMQRDFARVPGATVHDDPDLLWYTTPGSNSWLNGASRCDLGRDANERIGQVVAAADEIAMSLMWHQTPSSWPADLGMRLAQQGFEPTPEPGMAMRLDRPPDDAPRELIITEITSPAGVFEWAQAFDMAFGGDPRGDLHPWLKPFAALYLADQSAGRLLIGHVDGVAVATSLAFFAEGSVGLYGVGTVPARRGHGYGAALSAAGVEWGRRRGAKVAVLASTAEGFSVYQRLGFRTVCDTTSWFRSAGAP